jgi:hypothetical protein
MTAEEQVIGALRAAAVASARAKSWPPGLLERVQAALDSVDPDGWNPSATRRQWGEGAAAALAEVPMNAGERELLGKLQAVADGAAAGFEEESRGVLGPAFDQAEAAGAATGEAVDNLAQALSSRWMWAALFALVGGGLWLKYGRR